MENAKNAENKICHDCGKEIIFKGQEIENGFSLVYDNVTQGMSQKINIFKCNECFVKNKSLTNFQECEVYSRVVGYIRPVQQWHKGKKQEYGERQEFKIPGEPCC
jgi:ribonucleoside-triphosphate reductase